MFTLLCAEFIQHTVYRILSESAEVRRYDKNTVACFSMGHGVCIRQ